MKFLWNVFLATCGMLIIFMLSLCVCGIVFAGCELYRESGYAHQPPDYLLIKGERWYLEKESGLGDVGRYAETSCVQRIIYYDQDLSENIMRESLWHEIYHAELCGKNLPTPAENFYLNYFANWRKAVDGEEHDVVYPLSMAQASFMHDNPGFVRWAMEWR